MDNAPRLASFLALAALATAAACTPMRMKVDPALADDKMSVSKPGFFENGQLAFGEFAAGSIDRSWTHSRSSTVFNREHTRAKQTYRFLFAARGSVTDQVECETVYAETAHHVGTWTFDNGRHGLGCVLTGGNGQPRGELVMTEASRHRPSGRMYHQGQAIDVTPSMRGEGARWETTEAIGYELRADGQLIGAVQTINGGAVWIDRSAPPALQDSAALAAATMLLYQSIED